MRNSLPFLFFLVFSVVSASAQVSISGTVIDGSSQQPVEFATIKLLNAADEALLTGTTSDLDGRFTVEAPNTSVIVEISFIGYAAERVTSFGESPTNGAIDLGNVSIGLQGELLDDVIITAERSTTEFKLDRRVFNVGKDLSSAGTSALELLNNVPSVAVSIEGQVSLRGSNGVQILIDGKPSVLTSDNGSALGTITADMIESVEVITNPSAKYDAEGTSGIINIILKKEEKNGLNGSVTVNTGVPANHSVGVSVNRRSNKWNLFGQFGVGYRSQPEEIRSINRDLNSNVSVVSRSDAFRDEKFYNIILGTDYHINDLNVLSLTGFYAFEDEQQPSTNNFSVLNANGVETAAWTRTEETVAGNPKWQYEFNYKKQFDKDDKDHVLIVSALGNAFTKDQSSVFTNSNVEGVARFGDQLTATDFGEIQYTFKADYTRPISERVTLETGAQYVLNDVMNDFSVSDRVGSDFVVDSALTNQFEFQQGVLGVYATGSYESKVWGVKAGLRVEDTNLDTYLATTDERNDRNFFNFFPTLHSSYKVSDAFSMQAGYSRRIFRPRLWDLNPFFNVRDNFNVRTGNPNLNPEFTDSYEVTGIAIVGDISFNAGVYYRYTTNVVERISTVENNVNITQPINLGTTQATGIEFNAKYSPIKWLQFTTDLNYNTFNRKATLDDVSFDFNANQFNGRLVTKLELPSDVDLEFAGNTRSRIETIQGERKGFTFMDAGLRKKISGGKFVISANVRDVFASRIEETNLIQPDFTSYSRRFRGRFYTLGVSYGFGKGEAMEFVGRRRF